MNKQNKLNILVFMTDQQRGDTVYPYNKAYTPNLDKFAREGIAFSRTYCPSPHCCPARATFFTGLYPSEHGVWNNVNVGNALSHGLNKGVRLFSEDLKEAGYNLYYSGKWHVSATENPDERGWKVSYLTGSKSKEIKEDGNWHAFDLEKNRWERYKAVATEKGNQSRGEGQILRPGYFTYSQYGIDENPFRDNDVVEAAIDIIRKRERSDTPWCQFIGTLGPHDPYFVPKRFLDMYDINDIELPPSFGDEMKDKPALYRRTRDRFDQLTEREHRESLRHYLAFCTYEDYLFGEVLKALDEKGEAENTLVIYISDHGDYAAEHGLWCKGLPSFSSCYHVPAIVRWPEGIVNPGRIEDSFVSLADFAPTLLELAGVKAQRKFAGKSLVPFLRNENPEDWRDAIFTQTNGNELYGIQRSVMTKDWKYVWNGFDYDELYDLKNDPHEMNNLAGKPEYVEVVRNLSRKMWRFAYEQRDVCINWYIMTGLATFGPSYAFREDE